MRLELSPLSIRMLSLASVIVVAGIALGQDGGALVPPGRERTDTRAAEAVMAALQMKLPWPAGQKYEVYQANNGTFSHQGLNRFAWDFGLPEGTPVCAAAEGMIVRIKQDSETGGMDPRLFAHANTIIIDHGRGYFTQYLHLQKLSVLVTEGQIVRAGQMIARSGNTGFSSTPHLHFQVQDASGQSLPARFADVSGGIPVQGTLVTSTNDGTGTERYRGETMLPMAAFSSNSVLLSRSTLPAHRLRMDQEYTVEGVVPVGKRQVAVYLMNPDGGKAVFAKYAQVRRDGRFRLSFKIERFERENPWSDSLGQSNIFAFAIAPVEDDGTYWSSFSVPVTVR